MIVIFEEIANCDQYVIGYHLMGKRSGDVRGRKALAVQKSFLMTATNDTIQDFGGKIKLTNRREDLNAHVPPPSETICNAR